MRNFLNRLKYFIILAALQTLLFGHIHLFGYATVYIYLLFILKMPRFATRNEQMMWAFALGLTVDIFGNTPGINAAAATMLAFMRNYILAMFISNGINEDLIPSTRVLRWGAYVSYAAICTLLFAFILFTLELFTFSMPLHLLLSVGSSTLLTLLFLIVFESFNGQSK
ncbi:MAG: rod shape-determining protein MreD [Bacteroidaceae bacterium]|jgi:rod shape-determining protein MreD|nr:rod shape-determining protein MreD [Bacteroidaceae bacterium]